MSNYTKNKFVIDSNTPWYKIVALIKEGSSVLDIGCSSGNLGSVIKKEKKGIVVGVEIDREDAQRAKKVLDQVYTVNLETEDIPDPINKQKFDYIILSDVIEHFVNPVKTLAKIKPLLKPTGRILFSIPNMAHMSVRLMLLEGRFTYGETGLLDKTHLHFYDKEEVYRVFESAGYQIEVFGRVNRDYPREFLKSELLKLGLEPTEDFLGSRNTIEAGAYQFVGAASPVTPPNHPKSVPPVSPDVRAVEKYIKAIISQKDKDIRSLIKEKADYEKKLADTEKKLSDSENHTRNLKSQLETILTSKTYKIAKKLSTAKNRLTRK